MPTCTGSPASWSFAHRGQGPKPPLPPAFLAARRKIRGAAADTVVVGDQLATDVLGAHLTGMKAYMLQPLVEQDRPHVAAAQTSSGLFWESREPAINIAECEVSRPAARRRTRKRPAPLRAGRAARGRRGLARNGKGIAVSEKLYVLGHPVSHSEIAGHVQRRLREGGLALRSHGCADGARGRDVLRLATSFHQHHHAPISPRRCCRRCAGRLGHARPTGPTCS